MRHRKLRNGLRRCARRVFHGDAVFLRVCNVDIVNADACADDGFQFRAFCLVDLLLTDLRFGANDHNVKIAEGFAELVRLKKLIDDFMAHFGELCLRALVHAIGNENTHNLPPYLCSCSNFFRKSTSACTPSLGIAL